MKRTTMGSGYAAGDIQSLADLDRLIETMERPVILLEGTRALPTQDADRVILMGRFLAERYPQVVFRSGNAPGTDEAFSLGVAAVDPKRLEVVAPYARHRITWTPPGANRFSLEGLPVAAESRMVDETAEASPDLKRLGTLYQEQGRRTPAGSKGAYILRDTLKVLGSPEMGLDPATAGLFYVNPDTPLSGGTGHTIRVCLLHRVPAVYQERWMRWQSQS